ncbi:MAG: hypothetical protein IJN04_04740 [Clostridia bacterium]|nr:hypothetical protein [Clostridia bacterium]
MTVEPIENGNLRIWLADNEMEEWGLTDSQPKRVRRLVRRALSAVGRRPAPRMWAEMIPVDGGCVVLVSTEGPRHTRPTVYAVEAEHLAEVTARLRLPEGDTAQVYAVEDGYHVVVCSEEEGCDALLCEYGRLLGYGEAVAAHTAEYGEWILTMPAPASPTGADPVH